MQEAPEIILTSDEARSLRSSEAGKHLKQEIEGMLDYCRLQVDFVTAERLPVLQGRISALKDILNLLG